MMIMIEIWKSKKNARESKILRSLKTQDLITDEILESRNEDKLMISNFFSKTTWLGDIIHWDETHGRKIQIRKVVIEFSIFYNEVGVPEGDSSGFVQ